MLALLAIDFQRAFADDPERWGGERSEPGAESRALSLIDAFRTHGLPVIHVVHDSLHPGSPLRLGQPGGEPLPGFEPRGDEARIVKRENGAFAGTGLDALLRRAGVDRLVVAGLTVPHCVSTSVRTAANAGFDVVLAGDACAAFAVVGPDGRRRSADDVHGVELACLHGEFCTVSTADEVIGGLGDAAKGARAASATPVGAPAIGRDFETPSVRMVALYTVTVLCPIVDVDRIMGAVCRVAPLVQGPYDGNAFVGAPGIERYRPLEGAAAGGRARRQGTPRHRARRLRAAARSGAARPRRGNRLRGPQLPGARHQGARRLGQPLEGAGRSGQPAPVVEHDRGLEGRVRAGRAAARLGRLGRVPVAGAAPMTSPEFLLTALIVVLIPGTGVVYTVSTGLLAGWRASVAAALGCTFGIVPHLLASILGLAALLHASAVAFQTLRFAGVAYLLWLAWGLWRAPGTSLVGEGGERGATIRRGPDVREAVRIAVRGTLINVLNPKLSIFFLAFLPQFVPASAPDALPHLVSLGLVFMAMTFAVFVGYGIAADALARRVLSSAAAMRWIHRVFAAAFAGFALRLATVER